MTPQQFQLIKEQLEERRTLLSSFIAAGAPRELTALLERVDRALSRFADGSFGICRTCHDPVEDDRLAADPLIEYCIDHLTVEEQRDLERDIDLAARIQRALLPAKKVDHPAWEFFYSYQPKGPVSGDFCDIHAAPGGGGDFYFAVGDIAGKGVAASILMGHLAAAFRVLADLDLPPVKIVERANQVFCERGLATQFATLVVGRAGGDGKVELSNAGHCPPLLVRASGVESLRAHGLPVGMFGHAPYESTTVTLNPGDLLALYTDGLTEAEDGAGRHFGVERLTGLVTAERGLSPRDLVSTCLAQVSAFRGGVPAGDDLTVMMLKRARG